MTKTLSFGVPRRFVWCEAQLRAKKPEKAEGAKKTAYLKRLRSAVIIERDDTLKPNRVKHYEMRSSWRITVLINLLFTKTVNVTISEFGKDDHAGAQKTCAQTGLLHTAAVTRWRNSILEGAVREARNLTTLSRSYMECVLLAQLVTLGAHWVLEICQGRRHL